jgi:hypothetical protein
MSFDPVEFASRAIAGERDIVTGSIRSALSNIRAESDFFSKPGVAVAETLKEGLINIPLTNIGKISSWALKGMGKLLWGTVKVGAQLAMIAPLPIPLPAGCKTVAEVGWRIKIVKDTLAEKANGNPEECGVIFKKLYGSIGDVRNAAQGQATGNPALAS